MLSILGQQESSGSPRFGDLKKKKKKKGEALMIVKTRKSVLQSRELSCKGNFNSAKVATNPPFWKRTPYLGEGYKPILASGNPQVWGGGLEASIYTDLESPLSRSGPTAPIWFGDPTPSCLFPGTAGPSLGCSAGK
jgi:hypothetical protein